MVKAIVLGQEPRGEDVLRFIEAGANGYVLKDASFTELLQTIRAVYAGHTPCSPWIAALVFARIAALAREQGQHQHLPQVRLTPHEREVLQLIALGRRNGEIAHALGIALDTMKRHVANIFENFRCRATVW